MQNKMFKWAMVCIISALVFGGCNTAPEIPSVVERSTRTDTFMIREYPFENCDSEEPLRTEQMVSMPFTHEADVVVAPGLDIATLPLQLLVLEHYWVDSPVAQATTNIIVNVPAGYIYTYQVVWDKSVRIGAIVQDGMDIANYEFVDDLLGNAGPANMEPCSG